MDKVFLIPQFEMEKHQDICFKQCGKIAIGCITDPDLGPCYPCYHDDCKWERGRVELGTLASDDQITGYARALDS